MTANQTQLSYRRAAVENASSVGLVIILYDLLIDDLRQAMNSIEKRDIEERSKAIKHAFLVLQQLEGSLDWENGGESAKRLSKLYTSMRGRIFEAQMKVSSQILSEQVALLLNVRKLWEQVDAANSVPAAASSTAEPISTATNGETDNASWTA